MVAHSNSMDPAVTGDPSLLEPIVLHCADGDPPLRIVPASSQTYYVSARSVEACNRLVHEALRHPEMQLVSRSGGLLSNLSVLENMVLPAVYHGRVARPELANRIYQTFDACGLDRQQADALCERSAGEVEGFERLLVALLRALLMRPAVLVLERVFEGLTAEDMKRVAQFPRHYRRVVAAGAVVFIDRAGMACPDIDADVRAAAE
jgi:ABC-type lipoprotein export system ATPase subunit